MKAAQKRNWAKVTELVKDGVQPGTEALSIAIHEKNQNMAALLIAHGAKPDAQTFEYAVLKLDKDWIKMLLKTGATIDEPLMIKAVGRGWTFEDATQWIKLLIDAGAPVTQKVLMKPVSDKDFFTLRALLEVSQVVADEDTVLAGAKVNSEFARVMLDNGSKATQRMLYETVQWGEFETARILFKAGIVPDEKTLSKAVFMLNTDWVDLLIKAGAKPTSEMVRDTIYAPDEKARYNMGRFLLEHGAPATPEILYTIVTYEDWDLAKLIVDQGVKPNQNTIKWAKDILGWPWVSMLTHNIKPVTDGFNDTQRKQKELLVQPAATAKKVPLKQAYAPVRKL